MEVGELTNWISKQIDKEICESCRWWHVDQCDETGNTGYCKCNDSYTKKNKSCFEYATR